MVAFKEDICFGKIIRRYKRFFMDVVLENQDVVVAHVPNTGSMLGLLQENNQVMLEKSRDSKRRTAFTVQAILVDGVWVGVNTMLPNQLIKHSRDHVLMRDVAHYQLCQSEKPYGQDLRSRIDFYFSQGNDVDFYLEIKNVTLKVGSQAQFPDTVSVRAFKHLEDLLYVLHQGYKAGLYFIVQRVDCDVFAPAQSIDPKYAAMLSMVIKSGLKVRALTAQISPQGLSLYREIPCEC